MCKYLMSWTIFIYLSVSALAVQAAGESTVTSEHKIVQIDPMVWKERSFKVSPDGKRFAYVVQVGDKQAVVVDGECGRIYDGIAQHASFFSPDSRQVAYLAMKEGRWHMIHNDVEGPGYEKLADPTFSPDSRHIAYKAKVDAGSVMVLDGVEGRLYDSLGAREYSPMFAPTVCISPTWPKEAGGNSSLSMVKKARVTILSASKV